MKDAVGESAVVKKLCEQAHSANARLRLESLWALKQLVANAPRKLKQDVVDELGVSWMKLLIATDPYDIPAGEVIGLVERVYPPRSGYAEASDDVVMSEDSDGEESMSYTDTNSEHPAEPDDGFSKHTPEDDLAIQMQLLDVLRNAFVTSAMSESASELVDYVLQGMGVEDFFQIMKTRLSPRTAYGPTRQDNQLIQPPVGVITRVMYIILHIAACHQKWRMAIASNTELLRKFLALTDHEDREVRANCCWLAINLMFDDEGSDRPSCKHRAKELSKMGYRLHIQELETDKDLDVRERAKTAILLFSSLLDSGRS
jgi:armadillo repeat-containing protein 8